MDGQPAENEKGNSRSIFAGVYTYNPIDPAAALSVVAELGDRWLVPQFLEARGIARSEMNFWDGVSYKSVIGRASRSAWRKPIEANIHAYQAIGIAGYLPPQPGKIAAPMLGGLVVERPRWDSPRELEKASFVEFDLDPRNLLGQDTVTAEIQRLFIGHAIELFERFGGAYAYITKDFVIGAFSSMDSPYERFYKLRVPRLWRLREYARGYFWGNALSDLLVERIGGAERLTGLGFTVVRQIRGGWYVQITDDINNIERGALHRLRDVFSPILPPPNPDRSAVWTAAMPPYVL